jgi:hypothetical protein
MVAKEKNDQSGRLRQSLRLIARLPPSCTANIQTLAREFVVRKSSSSRCWCLSFSIIKAVFRSSSSFRRLANASSVQGMHGLKSSCGICFEGHSLQRLRTFQCICHLGLRLVKLCNRPGAMSLSYVQFVVEGFYARQKIVAFFPCDNILLKQGGRKNSRA